MEPILVNIAVGVALTVLSTGFALLRKKILSQIENDDVRQVADQVLDITEQAVDAANQTHVKHWKKKKLFSRKEKLAVKESVSRKIVDTVGSKRLGKLEKAGVNYRLLIDSAIESAVKRVKQYAK